MLITKASEYALLSMTIIAGEDKPIDTDKLSVRLTISRSFLAKVLQSLARADILVSYKGVGGGFTLAKDAKDIKVKDIIYAAEKKEVTVFECSHDEAHCPNHRGDFCQVWPFLNTLQAQIDSMLDSVTLQNIIDG